MGLPVLILGESGTGKSASLRNFKPEDLLVINVANKPLPFKNKIESKNTDDYKEIIQILKGNKKKIVVIDDSQYLMANEFMRRATEKGYEKFTEIAQNYWALVNMVKSLPQDQIIYFMAHIERDQSGNEKVKTVGRMLDEKITVEGMFTIVLKTCVSDGVYTFLTQNNGHDTVKSPIGMFSSYAIDNDLQYVDEKIRNYYEIGDFIPDEKMAEKDEEVKNEEIQMPERKRRTPRRSSKVEEEDISKVPLPFEIPETPESDPNEGVPEEITPTTEQPRRRRRRQSTENQ